MKLVYRIAKNGDKDQWLSHHGSWVDDAVNCQLFLETSVPDTIFTDDCVCRFSDDAGGYVFPDRDELAAFVSIAAYLEEVGQL